MRAQAYICMNSYCSERLRSQQYSTGTLKFPDGKEFKFTSRDLTDQGEIGKGAFATVDRMCHAPSGKVMAVKRIRSTVDEREQKQLLMDLDVVMRSNDCPFIVRFYGALFWEGDCWICMELMDLSLDKFYKFVFRILLDRLPESLLANVAYAVR
jgi:mitogen-activated protein kinase kinase 4